MSAQDKILKLIVLERNKQDQKWGANRTLPSDTWFRVLGEEVGEVARAINEHDADQLAFELIQSAAVIVAWLEDGQIAKITTSQGGPCEEGMIMTFEYPSEVVEARVSAREAMEKELVALRAEVERLRTALDEYDHFVKSISWREVYMGYRCMQGTITYDAKTFEGVMGDLAKAREALGGE